MKLAKVLFLTVIMASLSIVTSCSSDDYEPNPPVITYPSTGTPSTIGINDSFDFEFTVSAPRGYSSHFLTWTAGSVIQDNSVITDGETSFTVSGRFTAGDITGPGAISLAVTDSEGNSDLATIGFIVQ